MYDSDSDSDSDKNNENLNKKNNNLDDDFDDDIDNFNKLSMNDFDDDNLNSFSANFNDEIHIHKHMRNAKKCTTIVSGLEFKDSKGEKDFLSKVKNKFGIGGCQKSVEEINDKNLVYIFMGDYREKIKQFLIKEYDKDESCIKIHS
jgi:translation initiation factor 1 (eIF-1/SUI1)